MIKVRLFTLAIDPASGGFPTAPLAEMEEEVLQVSEHFFVHMGTPHLLLVVHYRDRSSRDRYIRNERRVVLDRPARPTADPGVRADLAQPEQEVFDRLRAWRNGRAQSEGVPPYVLLTNRQLAEVVKRQPATIGDCAGCLRAACGGPISARSGSAAPACEPRFGEAATAAEVESCPASP
jgi:superfamily II DNA helicase RecQ